MKYIGLILVIASLLSCHSDYSPKESDSYTNAKEMNYYEEDQKGESDSDNSNQERKIIKIAGIRIQVNDVNKSVKRIDKLAKNYNGFISNSNQANSAYSINSSITIRVPTGILDLFIEEIEKESIYTNYIRINSEDVSEKYYDLKIRLETKKTVRDRYIEILRNKAKTVNEILEAEDKIRIIQEEIESVEGRLKYLDNRTSLSTINLEIYQKTEYKQEPRINRKPFSMRIKGGIENGWDIMQSIVIGLVTIWPVLLLSLILYFYRRKLKNVFKRK